MNQVEVFVFLHSIGHGITTVSSQDTLGFRRSLPTHEVEFIPDPVKPRRGLIRMPYWLAQAHNLMPTKSQPGIGANKSEDDRAMVSLYPQTATDSSNQRPTIKGDGMDNAMAVALKEERRRGEEARARFRPARDTAIGNEAGLLGSHRARSQVEQLASELPAESFAGE